MKKRQLLKVALFGIGSMLFSSNLLMAQVKIGTNPTVINPTNNLEVEASTPGRKFSIDKTTGKMTLADSSQADGRILTSDANGTATWKPMSQARVAETVFIGEQPGENVITNWGGVFNALKDRPTLVPREGSLGGWDAANNQYVIQETGYYRIYAGISVKGTLPPPQVTRCNVYLAPWQVLNVYENMSSAVGPTLPVFWEGNLQVGQRVTLYIANQPNGANEQHFIASRGFLSITKLF